MHIITMYIGYYRIFLSFGSFFLLVVANFFLLVFTAILQVHYLASLIYFILTHNEKSFFFIVILHFLQFQLATIRVTIYMQKINKYICIYLMKISIIIFLFRFRTRLRSIFFVKTNLFGGNRIFNRHRLFFSRYFFKYI